MRSARLLLSLAVLTLSAATSAGGEPSATSTILGQQIENFALPDTSGKLVSLTDFRDMKAVAVVFVGTECPVNNAYLQRLGEMAKEYGPKQVQFLAINSNSHDTAEDVAEHAREHQLTIPVLKDEGNRVADLFTAERTPEAFVLDEQRKVRYRGRIDNQYGVGFRRPQPTRQDLALALDEVLAGRSVTEPVTEVSSCRIARVIAPQSQSSVTYARHVAPLLQRHCQECHRPSQIGPMDLLTYEDAKAWSATIREAVVERRMPPWHADARYGKFANARGMSEEEIKTLLAWIDEGCAAGDQADAPPPRNFAAGWRIGEPDVVLSMPTEFTVPAETPENGIPYQNFNVPTNFDEDVWVQAAEARPGCRAVVHHIVVFVQRPTAEGEKKKDRFEESVLAIYTPGDMPTIFPTGIAKKIPQGSKLVFQMHYTPNGVQQTDRSSVGLVFSRKPPKQQARTHVLVNHDFEIPPGAANHEVTAEMTVPFAVRLVSLFPHMHLRGKSFEYLAEMPNGERKILLSVPRYDFNWQTNYRLDPPLELPAGARIRCTAHFDNSSGNFNNPDPSVPVRWGEQTWEEMMIGFIDYVRVDQAEGP
ncbi:MAG TPA: redoxin domain-containing protein [Pirellulales bacterium]|nr:redoxin domain-containing protein [Pirellulales bacterium]